MGIDNGGTFSKAALFDENGVQISVASVPTVTLTPKPGYTERDMRGTLAGKSKGGASGDRKERDRNRKRLRACPIPGMEKVCIWSWKRRKTRL